MTATSEPNLERRARYLARRKGLAVRKSRSRMVTLNNRGQYMLVDPARNWIVAGERYDWALSDIIEYCESVD